MTEEPIGAPDAIDPETGLPLAELQREFRRRDAVDEANADPLPGPLALAFPSRPIRVGPLAVRPVMAIDYCLLRHLDSPLLKQMAEAAKPAEERQATVFTDEDGWMMALQFLVPPERAEAEVLKGRDHFLALAKRAIGRMNPIVVNQIVEAVSRQFRLSFETAVQFAAQSSGAPQPFFTEPPPAPRTASAGGLNISAA